MEDSVSKIPHGYYCYEKLQPYVRPDGTLACKTIGLCPFWSISPSHPEQENGYCSYLNKGDWEEDGTMFLWDMVKECNLNVDKDEL